ncbi:homocysteine S-methyltransferase family protein [Clostridium sp. YIM B02555]|uniref:homocysteine S-methyltransferase family protein n=1 Tax=Clostridium sp. YIM B02555 TaxID=2911968 RepID=UPI001EEE82EE|nr:homocysteine S-methyltransferase family protein [Clostridium sp. YIM B02555]
MNFEICFNESSTILMEGALGERLKREYNIMFEDKVAMANLIYDDKSRQAMQTIFQEYVKIAEKYSLPFIATTPTRRANKERVFQSNLSEKIIEDNVRFLQEIKKNTSTNMFVGGLMGCKGDAYKATEILSMEEAQEFHSWQATLFKNSGVDFLYAGIMPALSEAIGMAKAMESTGLPYIISFMIRNNGKLIDGTTIHNAILNIDEATVYKPIGYMTNCIHPEVLEKALSAPFNKTKLVKSRFCGIQANTSPLSPEELDNYSDLKSSDSVSLAVEMMKLEQYFTPKIFGGCCGTDNTHIEEIAKRIKK